MEWLENIVLEVCACHPTAVQLIEHGYFPCAPLYPTLAVSLDMLEFTIALFLRMAPNERAWAETMVEYLKACGHEFATGDSFRRHFANALAYYQLLVRLVNAEVAQIIEVEKGEIVTVLDEAMSVNERAYLNANVEVPNDHTSASNTILQPHKYLRSQCPLCFGGNHTDSANKT